ncbi:MAG: prolyl oligopeptidase family serine peptidase [Planctomycetes bacterium]|nr:prolyl oligopeptidase family serine peptidase [Planctomycetota bacterium]
MIDDVPGKPPFIPRADRGWPKEFVEKTLTLADKSEWKYVVYVPPQYESEPDHLWPVILFMHGSGERGADNHRQTNVGLPNYIRKHLDSFPFIVVMPQVQEMWYRGQNMNAVWMELETTLREYRTDRDRVYCTGLSMGGFGTWELASFQPDVFAAVVPVCGVAPMGFISNMVDTPVWAFHGSEDPNVPVAGSRDAVAKLKELGGNPKYTEYPKQSHKIWDQVYSSKQLYRWMLGHRRPPPPKKIEYHLPGPIGKVWWLTARAEPDQVGKARIRAELNHKNELHIETKGILSWAVVSKGEPLKPGDDVTVFLGGVEIYAGKFSGAIGYNIQAATQPATTQSTEHDTPPPDSNDTPAPETNRTNGARD